MRNPYQKIINQSFYFIISAFFSIIYYGNYSEIYFDRATLIEALEICKDYHPVSDEKLQSDSA